MIRKSLQVVLALTVTLLASCGSGAVFLSGAGATFPAPFYTDATKQYGDRYGVRVSYGATGSGAGVRNLHDHTVDFGGTDVFLSSEDMERMPAEVLHIPTCIGGVVMAYNIEGVEELNLTPALITKIYLGEVTNWQDPEIVAINEGIALPNLAITPIYRSEGSGTTAVFSGFMAEVDEVWSIRLGAGKSVNFPNGVAAKGNPGVAGVIDQTPGAIGYLGSEYSLAMNIPAARLLNQSGNFIPANMTSIALSAEGDMPDDSRVVISNASHPDAYPISTLTWLIVYKEQAYSNRSLDKAKALQDFLRYLVGDEGAESATKTHYVPLSPTARAKALQLINSMTYEGVPLSQMQAE